MLGRQCDVEKKVLILVSLMSEDDPGGEPQALPSGKVAAREPRTLLLLRAQ